MLPLKKCGRYLMSRLDFKVYPDFCFFLVCCLLIAPAALYLPVEQGYETGIVENAQLAILLTGIGFCFAARREKALFKVIAAILFLMALREVNFGKVLFYPDPVQPNKFLSWDHIWYAPYVDPALILYGIGMLIFAIRKKLWNPLIAYVLRIRIPVWILLGAVCAAIAGLVADKTVDNEILEEMIELAAYVAIVGMVRLYAFWIFLPGGEVKAA